MDYRLSKLLKEVKELGVKDKPLISKEGLKEICKLLSEEAAVDFKRACKNGYIEYSVLTNETLIELSEKILVAGEGDGTVIIIDDI